MIANVSLSKSARTIPAVDPLALTVIMSMMILAAMEVAWVNVSDPRDGLRIATALTVPGIILYLYTWKYLREPLYMPYPIFLFAAYIYHFGQFMIDLFGYDTRLFGNDRTLDLFRFKTETLHSVQVLAWMCISGLQIGALLAARKYRAATFKLPMQPPSLTHTYPVLIVGLLLAAIAVIPAFSNLYQEYQFRNSVGTLQSYVAKYEQAGVANVTIVIGQALWPGLFFACAASFKRRWVMMTTIIICIVWFAANILVGDRSDGIQPAIALLWLYNTIYKTVKWRYLIGAAAFLAFVINPLVALTRNASTISNLSAATLRTTSARVQNPVVLFMDETGISAIPLADTLELIPSERPFSYGTGYIENLITGPFSYFLFNAGGQTEDDTPAYWLVKTRYPQRLKQSEFLGYSFIAEAYMQFGYFSPIVTALFGYFLIWLTFVAMKNRSAYVVGAQAIIISYLIHFARGDSGDLGRPFMRYVLLPIVLMWLLEQVLSRTTAKRELLVA
jgi:oligosaccharide repeat unit polymerase